jgi:pyruvate/2-oxoglutarate dehydrogenase complex dihydrolipoamide acyltransferase (E2) component
MQEGTIFRVLASSGVHIERGAKLLEIRVLAPAFIFRIVALEPGWLRSLYVRDGDCRSVGAALGIVSTERDEAIDGAIATRAFRVSVATVLA